MMPTIAKEIDNLIAEGKLGEARLKTTLALKNRRTPRSSVLPLATIARRLGLSQIALQALAKIVRPSGRAYSKPTPQEVAEYSASLIRLGAHIEAESLLRVVDEKIVPEKLLYAAYARVAVWDYAAAYSLFENYLRRPDVDRSHAVNTKLNLAACAVANENRATANRLLSGLELMGEERENFDLLAVVYELRAQLEVFQRQFSAARIWLAKGKEISDGHHVDHFFIRKWSAITDRLESPGFSASRLALGNLKLEAEKRRHWETVRECDLFEAIASKDSGLFKRVYFGTPSPFYRQRMLRLASVERPPEGLYLWTAAEERNPRLVLNLNQVEEWKGLEPLRSGGISHRLLAALCSDYYRPHPIAGLFHSLHPEEYFNVATSPGRVYVEINRLKAWISANRLGAKIKSLGGGYRLNLANDLGINMSLAVPPSDGELGLVTILFRRAGSSSFTSRDAMTFLNISRRTANRVLKRGIAEGVLAKSPKGRTVVYSFKIP